MFHFLRHLCNHQILSFSLLLAQAHTALLTETLMFHLLPLIGHIVVIRQHCCFQMLVAIFV